MFTVPHLNTLRLHFAAAILILSPFVCHSSPAFIPSSLSGSPQMDIRPASDSTNALTNNSAISSTDTAYDLVVVLFSGPNDTIRDTLTRGMIPALEVAAIPADRLEKFTSISVRKTIQTSSQRIVANNYEPKHLPVW
jgi:hypothetical protein